MHKILLFFIIQSFDFFAMAPTNKMIYLILMTIIVLFNADANQVGDVQEEIRFMKGEIKGMIFKLFLFSL